MGLTRGGADRGDLLCPLPALMGFPQPHSRPPAIVIDKFDACGFQGASDCQIVRRGQGSDVIGEFSAAGSSASLRLIGARDVLQSTE